MALRAALGAGPVAAGRAGEKPPAQSAGGGCMAEISRIMVSASGRARPSGGGVAGCSGRDEPVPVAAAVAELTLPARHFPV